MANEHRVESLVEEIRKLSSQEKHELRGFLDRMMREERNSQLFITYEETVRNVRPRFATDVALFDASLDDNAH